MSRRRFIPGFAARTLSRQLGSPSGPLGSLVVRILNRGNRPTIVAAVRALGLSGGEQVADIGFGGGLGLRLLVDAVGPGGQVHGVEPSTAMVERARGIFRDEIAAGRLLVHAGSMQSLPFADQALDGWISCNTVYFVEDMAPALAELVRVLAPGGTGVISVADPDWLARQPFAQHGFTVRSIDDLVRQLAEAGLTADARRVVGGIRGDYLLVCRPVTG